MIQRTFRYRELKPKNEWSHGIPTLTDAIEAEGCYLPDTYLNGRPVYFGGIHLDGVDSYFIDACFADSLEDLTEEELFQLDSQCGDYIVEKNLEHFGFFKK